MACTFGKTEVQKNCYMVGMTKSDGGAGYDGTVADKDITPGNGDLTSAWVKIGALAENPTLKTAEGDTIGLSDCTTEILSETVEFNCEVLEVTTANWTNLRLVHNEEVDVIFYTVAGDTNAIGATEIKLSAQLEITGNDMNKIILSGKVETSDVDANDKINFVSIASA